MKRFSLHLVLVCMSIFAYQIATAQVKKDKKEKDEIHLKVKVIEDGKERILDTVFYDFKGSGEIMKMMKLKNFPDSLVGKMGKHMIWFSDSSDFPHGKHSEMIQTYCFVTDSARTKNQKGEIRMMKTFKFSDDKGNTVIHSGDSCTKEIMIEMLRDGKYGVHVMPQYNMNGERVIVVSASDDVKITEEGGMKVIKIKSSGDHKVWIEKDGAKNVEVEVTVEESDGKKEVKKIERKIEKKKK